MRASSKKKKTSKAPSQDLGDFQQALHAMKRLFELEAPLDIEVS